MTKRRPLNDLEVTALALMSTKPEGWNSADLTRKIQAASPDFGCSRTVRRAFVALEDRELAVRKGENSQTMWSAPAAGRIREDMIRPSPDLSIALLKLNQLTRRHLPGGAIGGEMDVYFKNASRVLHESPVDSRLSEARAWIGKTARLDAGYPLIPAEVNEETFKIIWKALYKDECLDILYKNAQVASNESKRHRILPYAIVEKGPVWYLVVKKRRSSGDSDPFLLRIDRILEVKTAGFDMKRDPKFDLDAYIKNEKGLEFFAEEPQLVVLRVREHTSESRFRTVRLSVDQEIVEEKGGFVLTSTVALSQPFKNLLLECSPNVEVLSPPHLREEISRTLQQALAPYCCQ